MNDPSLNAWIRRVDGLREKDDLLARGAWHAYKSGPGGDAPMVGEFFIVRYRSPTVAISNYDQDELLRLAHQVERALQLGSWG